MSVRRTLLPTLLLPLAACGGGSSVTGPGTTPSGGTQSVTVVVFYDENGSGVLDAGEAVRVPDVEVSLGGRTGRSAPLTGRAVIEGVPTGTFTPTVTAATLPPFYAAGRGASVRVPTTGEVAVPVVLAIGANRPNTYLAFGDSITAGDNFPGDDSYRGMLEGRLAAQLGRAQVIDDGVGSTKSNQGADRIGTSLSSNRPAYTLIMYGTNDWTQTECRKLERLDTICFTVPSLRAIVRSVKAASSLPVLATIPPVNTFFNELVPPQRNDWVSAADVEIRTMAAQEGAVLADVETSMLAAAGDDLGQLFVDH